VPTSRAVPATDEAVRRILEQTVFAPVRQGDIVAETVARLGQAIGMGLLRPGDRLPPESRLAEDLGISSASLRSALAMLRSAGVLETQRGRGGGSTVTAAAVPVSSGAETLPEAGALRDLVDYRCVVEGGAAALAAHRATPEQLARLDALVMEMEAIDEFDEWSGQDTLLHLLVADASGSVRLLTEVGRVRAEVYRLSQLVPVPPQASELADREHRTLVAAIASGDPVRAREAMVGHVESTRALWVGLGRVPGAPPREAHGPG
jgi:GntR family transcriptional repressor for pyruvate dehydrogenase complex